MDVDPQTNRLQGTALYDDAGNLTQWAVDDLFTYDAPSMVTTHNTAGRVVHMLYTADDERIAQVERLPGTDQQLHNKTTWTLRAPENQLLRVFTDDATSGSRIWSWTEDEIWRGTSLMANESPVGTRHVALDHLGSPRLVTSAAGALLGTEEFSAFGEGGTTGAGALEFTGHERDWSHGPTGWAETFDYMHARYYAPTMGRFLSVDPVHGSSKRPQTWDLYTYASNNPLRFVDPDRQMRPKCDVSNCPPPAPIETVVRVTPQSLEQTAKANADKLPTMSSASETTPTPGLVTVTGGVSVNFVALGGGNAGVGVMHANRVGTQHAALYAEGGVHTPSPRGSAGLQATIGIFRGDVTDQRGSFTNANFTIMQLGVTLVFTKAGGLVGVSGSWGPSVGAGYSTSESNTVW